MKIIIGISSISLLLDLLNGLFALSGESFLNQKIAVLLPAIYIGISFVLFKNQPLGYRIFHHICLVPLALYNLLGVVINFQDIYLGGTLESMLAYNWFSSLSFTYLFFSSYISLLICHSISTKRFTTSNKCAMLNRLTSKNKEGIHLLKKKT